VNLPSLQAIQEERCRRDPVYFLVTFCTIYDATRGEWVPFVLWPSQEASVNFIHKNKLVVALKARQVGWSWMVLGFALWLMLFHPAATVLVFSKREEESKYLLSDLRLRGMFARLPAWIKELAGGVVDDAATSWGFGNGSVIKAFPTTAGDSYTATLAIVDEAALCPDLGRLMRSVKPTIDGGGRMILLSRANKDEPDGEFAKMYRAARAGSSPWKSCFMPWHSRPDRDAAWYEAQRQDVLQRTGSLHDLREQYPDTDDEAMERRTGSEWPDEYFGPHLYFDEWPGRAALAAFGVALDPSKGRDAKAGDYSAYVWGGLDYAGTLWVDADLQRRPSTAIVEAGVELCRTLRPDGFGVETNQFQELLANDFLRVSAQHGVTLPLYKFNNFVNKQVRIRRCGPWLAQKRLRVKAGSVGGRLLVDQLMAFGEDSKEHDDGPDALEMLTRLLTHLVQGRAASVSKGHHSGLEMVTT
jgi:predicted phage terminase large subunit-like protein